jgi:pyruvate-formate lyase-activating enzyme
MPEIPPLKKVHLELNVECNARCIICPNKDVIDREPNLHIKEIFKRIIQEDLFPLRNQIECIEFHNYNEPTIDWESFLELSKLTNQYLGDGKVGIVTNGQLLDEDKALQLYALKPKHIIFSVDALDRELFHKIRPGLDYDVVYKNVLFFIKVCNHLGGKMPIIVTTVGRHNDLMDDLKAIKHFFGKYNVSHFFQRFVPRGTNEDLMCYPNFTHLPCNCVSEDIYVLCNGIVTACCEDYNGMMPMGNVIFNTISEVWGNERYQELREAHNNSGKANYKLCRECKAYYNEPLYKNNEIEKEG